MTISTQSLENHTKPQDVGKQGGVGDRSLSARFNKHTAAMDP
jgi:hypothetical protein